MPHTTSVERYFHSGSETQPVFVRRGCLLEWSVHWMVTPGPASALDRYFAGDSRSNIFENIPFTLPICVFCVRQIIGEADHYQICPILFFEVVQLPCKIGVLLFGNLPLLVHDICLGAHDCGLSAIDAQCATEHPQSQSRQQQAEYGEPDARDCCDSSPPKLIGFIVAPLSIIGLILGIKSFDRSCELARQGVNRAANWCEVYGWAPCFIAPVGFFTFEFLCLACHALAGERRRLALRAFISVRCGCALDDIRRTVCNKSGHCVPRLHSQAWRERTIRHRRSNHSAARGPAVAEIRCANA